MELKGGFGVDGSHVLGRLYNSFDAKEDSGNSQQFTGKMVAVGDAKEMARAEH
jgi:hypothetical protein